jgi:7-carboxy-7-deazaguanine synthase
MCALRHKPNIYRIIGMNVKEIFYSIQGESTFAGQACIFIRFSFCNLRCTYCDTSYSFSKGEDMSIDEILKNIEKYPSKLVELTGGEPLLQKEINILTEKLLEKGYTVLCETSGSIDIDKISNEVYRIMDIKTPGSAEVDKNNYKNIEKLTDRDEIKFVICDRNDFEWAQKLIREKSLEKFRILFSPEHENMPPAELSKWILESGLNVRLQLQMHKYIWPNIDRGV